MLCTRFAQAGHGVGGNVVVVAIESALRNALRGRERVQLVEALVADEVRPQPAVRRPHRVIDEYGHTPSIGLERMSDVDFAASGSIR